jgi:hypothetical protein
MTFLTGKTSLTSTNNTTTTPLPADDTFIGISEDVHDAVSISIHIDSNVTSAINGLTFEFSIDNIIWDSTFYTYTYKKGYTSYDIDIKGKYFRVKLINGPFIQSTLNIHTIIHYVKQNTEQKILGRDLYISAQHTGTVMAAVHVSEKHSLSLIDNQYTPLQVNDNGELRIDTSELISIRILLEELIIQQKITNTYFEQMMDEKIVAEDI